VLLPFCWNCRGHLGGFFFFFFQTHAQARKHSGHKDKQPKETWLSPHARDKQLQVGSSGDPIRPLVAEMLNINLLIGQGGKGAACLCGRCVCWLAREFEKRKRRNPLGGHSSEKTVIPTSSGSIPPIDAHYLGELIALQVKRTFHPILLSITATLTFISLCAALE